jgi:2-iminobutanoate/2-iminopropanoate deaminase
MVGRDDVRRQTKRVMDNLAAILETAGSTLSRCVKATIYLTDLNDFDDVNDVYGSYFEDTTPPARACVQVAALPRGAKVEIELVAQAKRIEISW